MAAALKLPFAMLLLCIFTIGESQHCNRWSILIQTTNTGEKYNDHVFIFDVHVTNRCRCPVSNVHLQADGFSSLMPVDRKAFRQDGAFYLVNDGQRIANMTTFKFQYAYSRMYRIFPTENFRVDCL